MNQQERLLQFIEKMNISRAEFERRSGLANGYVKKLKGSLGEEKLNDVLTAFPNLSKVWLLTGEGDMLNDNKRMSLTEEQKDTSELSEYETYLLPMSAMGGSLTGISEDGTFWYNCERIISPVKGCDCAINVSGDSMSPEYPSGSRIYIKKINPNIFIDWGKTYVLDTCNGIVVKEIHKCEKEGYITCHSVNPDPKYADFDVPMSEIYGIYRVLVCVIAK